MQPNAAIPHYRRVNTQGGAYFFTFTLPVIISFFAGLLGLGGIAAAIQGIIRRPRRRVDREMDKALRRIARRLGIRGRGRRRRGVDVRRYRQLADQAAAELSRVTGPPQSPDALRRQKRQQARQLQRTYSSRLGRGARMRIQIARARRGQEERGIGFTIAVRPGSVRKRGTIAVVGGSAEVRAAARRALVQRLGSGVRDASQVRQAYAEVYQSLQPRGLRYLGVETVPRKPGLFNILISASSLRRETPFEYVPPEPNLQFSAEELNEMVEYGGKTTTYAMAWHNGRPIVPEDGNKWESQGTAKRNHAEARMIRELRRRHKELSFRANDVFTILVTRMPCPSCSSIIRTFISKFRLRLRLRMMRKYRTTDKAYNEKGDKILKDLRDKGHALEPLSLEEVVKEGLVSNVSDVGEFPEPTRTRFGSWYRGMTGKLRSIASINQGRRGR